MAFVGPKQNTNFGLSVRKWAEHVKERQEEVTRLAVFKVFARIIERSPVGNPDLWESLDNPRAVRYNQAVSDYNDALRQDASNLTKNGRLKRGLKVNDSMEVKKPDGYTGGRFRANWQVGIDNIPTGQIDAVDPSGSKTTAAALSVLSTFKVGTTQRIYFVNNLPYGYPLEYEGHSKQAPAGMVRISCIEFDNFVKEALGEVK
uniref:Tail completion or Neck1 protein n=1 Tax=Pectobacterium phage Amona TaxID=3158137 RepID=A0AB39ABE1_9CAUD